MWAMDQGTYFKRQRVLAGSGSQSDSTECAEKVEAMLSTAIMHQEDLWSMLMMHFPEGMAFDPNTGLLTTVAEISADTLTAMKAKLENAIEWCQLAQIRLKDITDSSKDSASTRHSSAIMYGRHRS